MSFEVHVYAFLCVLEVEFFHRVCRYSTLVDDQTVWFSGIVVPIALLPVVE